MSAAKPSRATSSNNDSRFRATAVRHARGIADKKALQAQIADLVIEAFDLPSSPQVRPETADQKDVLLFKKCLSLFQPSDLNDLIHERNIDNRCGYALCSRPNKKLKNGGTKVWNHKSGKDFKLVDRAELERWCSEECEKRTEFLFRQLNSEPAWLRQDQPAEVKLLDEILTQVGDVATLDASFQHLSLASTDYPDHMEVDGRDEAEKSNRANPMSEVKLIERLETDAPSAPNDLGFDDIVEGHKAKHVRFADE